MTPSVGRIVHYMLTEQDAAQVMRRRTDGPSIADRVKEDKWPVGAQAHVGNPVSAGDVYPMLIVWVSAGDMVNGRVFLDGSDDLWVTSREQVALGAVDKRGYWFQPARV